jgi:ATP-dependent Clp protease ATP-binding subunit ClpA
MTKTNKRDLKVACDSLNRFISVKDISTTSLKVIIRKLKKIVKNSKPGSKSILQYVKCVILNTLPPDEQDSIEALLKSLDHTKPGEAMLAQNILASVYNSVCEIYPLLRVELVCGDFNGFPLAGDYPIAMEDSEFEEKLEKEVKPKKSSKKEYEFKTMDDIEELRKFLSKNIIGQQEAVDVVCDTLALKAVNFSKTVSLFFIGKTGRGKTELARLLGQKYSGNYRVINCSEYSNGHEVNRLLGSPPGYVGYSGGSLMKELAAKSSKWIILFDEIEKAHDKFFNFLLSLTETGKCEDNSGNTIDLSDSIFVFTSNCGMKDLRANSTNFHFTSNLNVDRLEIMKSVEQQFSPEFRNRIDEFVFFNDLTPEDAKKIAELRLKDLPLKKTPELISFVVKNGFSEEFGARGLGRFIKKSVALPLAKAILSGKTPTNSYYEVIVNNSKVEVVNTSSNK